MQKQRKTGLILARDVITDRRGCCSLHGVCAEHSRANPKEPMIPMEVPDRPWAKVGADLFELNSHHTLVTADYFSQCSEISKLHNLTAKNAISYIKSQIFRYGILDEVITDNGAQFACAEFAQFLKDCDIKHITSGPYHQQANGRAERNVQTVKRLLVKRKTHTKCYLITQTVLFTLDALLLNCL